MNVDCLIVGAGPTGLTLGMGLLLQGKTVLICDKHNGGAWARAIHLSNESVEGLAKLRPCIEDKLHAAGVPVDGVTLHLDGVRVINRMIGSAADAKRNGICLPQSQTERVIMDEFLALGGTLIRGFEFTESHEDSSFKETSSIAGDATSKGRRFRVSLTGYPDTTITKTVSCNWLLGCDGFRSAVRQYFNIEYPGNTLEPVEFVAMDVKISKKVFPTTYSGFLYDNGSGFVAYWGPTSARIFCTTNKRDELFARVEAKEVLSENKVKVHWHMAKNSGSGHVWLAGDAVHVHSPLGGQGMNMGIADGIALAKAIGADDMSLYAHRHEAAHAWVTRNKRETERLLLPGCHRRTLRFIVLKIARFFIWVERGVCCLFSCCASRKKTKTDDAEKSAHLLSP